MKFRSWRSAGVAALALLFSAAPAFAQQVASQAVLDRVTIVEGQTRGFQISNVTSRPRYHVHASVSGAYTAEAGDVTITTDNLLGGAQTITPDETFGVRLCTTADCAGGTVLGEWTVTVTEPAADTTLSGTGATLTIPGGATVSVMEDSRNRDSRYTPNHIGFRYVEFRGVGAQTATIVLHARDGFDDGETYDEAFAITFPNDFAVFDEDTDQPFTSSPVDSNLGGGVQAMPAESEAWFGIAADDEPVTVVPATWSLLPSGVQPGDKFRMVYVTRGETAATSTDIATYDAFVREEITGNQLKNGGVDALKPFARHFVAIAGTAEEDSNGNILGNARRKLPASVHGEFSASDPWRADHPNVPFHWVGGAKVADSNADFTDRTWDDESNPRHADGTVATVDAGGYWTGSQETGDFWSTNTSDRTTIWNRPARCTAGINTGDQLFAMGAGLVWVGYLNDSDPKNAPLGRDIGDAEVGRNASMDACIEQPSTETRPMYALSGVFSVLDEGAAIADSSAAEGAAATFTVTIPEAAPAGGVTIPYTLSNGRGVSGDPARIVATGADYSDAGSGSIVIAQGATTGTITVNTTDDSTYEGDHYFTVTKTGTTLVPASVYWTTADAGHLQFAPGDTSRTIAIDLVDDDAGENAETFKVRLGQPSEATLGGNDEATVTLNDDDGGIVAVAAVVVSPTAVTVTRNGTVTYDVSLAIDPGGTVTVTPTSGNTAFATVAGEAVTFDSSNFGMAQQITVTGVGAGTATITHAITTGTADYPTSMSGLPSVDVTVTAPTAVDIALSASDGDANGNAVENASDTTGHRTLTLTLGRTLNGAETVTVPLTVRGATVATDYTFGLRPATQNGVTLLTSNPHSAQNPAVRFAGGASTATLRTISGGPVGIVLVDDETGDIVVPADFASFGSPHWFVRILDDDTTPTASIAGGSAVTEGEKAQFTVSVAQEVAADLRVDLMVSDASGGDFIMAGDEGGKSVTIAKGAKSATYEVQTVGDSVAEANGDITVAIAGSTDYTTGTPSSAMVTVNDDDTSAATPEVSLALQTGETSNRNDAGQLDLAESGGVDGAVFNLSADSVLASTLTVCLRLTETGGDLVAAGSEGIRTATLTSSLNANGAGIYRLNWTGDGDDERNSVVTATLLAPETANCPAANGSYTVASAMASDAVLIEDDDATAVELTSSDPDMAEGDASDTATLTVTLGRRMYAGEAVVVPFTLATSTGARLPGNATPDFTVSASGTGVTIARDNTATPSVTFTGDNTNTVRTATVSRKAPPGRTCRPATTRTITGRAGRRTTAPRRRPGSAGARCGCAGWAKTTSAPTSRTPLPGAASGRGPSRRSGRTTRPTRFATTLPPPPARSSRPGKSRGRARRNSRPRHRRPRGPCPTSRRRRWTPTTRK